jgi:homoserine/homoserine lactone efflux protein
MNPVTWWIFVASETVLCLTPGPAVLFIISSALRSGGVRSIGSNLGILTANSVYFALSGTGVSALLVASYSVFSAVKWIGAAYLIYMGLSAIFGKSSIVRALDDPRPPRSARRLFVDGFVVQMSNPKAIIFFSALLPQFVDSRAPVGRQIIILGITSAIIEFSILLGYGLAAGRAAILARQPRYATWTNRIAGGLLVGAGAGLATINRR